MPHLARLDATLPRHTDEKVSDINDAERIRYPLTRNTQQVALIGATIKRATIKPPAGWQGEAPSRPPVDPGAVNRKKVSIVWMLIDTPPVPPRVA